jgi:RNA polymerase sigma-70 factor (ECF subfamily)
MGFAGNDFIGPLRTYVRRRVPSSSDADDVVQTVLLRLLESDVEQSLASPTAWVLSAARTAIADHHRSRARSAELLPNTFEIPTSQPEDASDITECLVPLLAGLASDDQALLRRVDLEGESQAALAQEMGLSVSGLKSRVQRARGRLRDAVLSRCEFERDSQGSPIGPATCRPTTSPNGCGCNAEADANRGRKSACD